VGAVGGLFVLVFFDRFWNCGYGFDGGGAMNEAVIQMLLTRKEQGLPVGFSIWKDGDKSLWGLVLDVQEKGFIVRKVGVLGELYAEDIFIRWKEIHEWNFGEEYARRLLRFGEMSFSLPERGKWRRSAQDRDRLLAAALSGRYSVQVWFPNELRHDVLVISLSKRWLYYRFLYDDGSEREDCAIRLSLIKAVREHDACAEGLTHLWLEQVGTSSEQS
jgi:hypothetical protein